ncbi:hypothetical protein PI124_g20203 [Phytophthora idaei]|nr:hypothetical protein PI125_g3641 [Phytophthora idaei]KAG3132661.1 hypothetical protein PI126_g19542 [Phytophthora idaei]KAG3234746.1 hypothetical protein PI124_g20203 [Phytophthora idaei]
MLCLTKASVLQLLKARTTVPTAVNLDETSLTPNEASTNTVEVVIEASVKTPGVDVTSTVRTGARNMGCVQPVVG